MQNNNCKITNQCNVCLLDIENMKDVYFEVYGELQDCQLNSRRTISRLFNCSLTQQSNQKIFQFAKSIIKLSKLVILFLVLHTTKHFSNHLKKQIVWKLTFQSNVYAYRIIKRNVNITLLHITNSQKICVIRNNEKNIQQCGSIQTDISQ